MADDVNRTPQAALWRELKRAAREYRNLRGEEDMSALRALESKGTLSLTVLNETNGHVRLRRAGKVVDYWVRSGTVSVPGHQPFQRKGLHIALRYLDVRS